MTIAGKNKKIRLDELLVRRALVADLDSARRYVMAGKVYVEGQKTDKSGSLVEEHANISLQERAYVSRGGLKLAGFLQVSGLSTQFKNANVLDIGSSTGGFTDCSLRCGASTVTALDVGKGLLDWTLRQDPRVIVREETHLRDFSQEQGHNFDIILADVSFNSIARLFKYIHQINHSKKALVILLIKPQFELARDKVPSGGVISNEADRLNVVSGVQDLLASLGYEILMARPSTLKGTKGNQEYFIAATARS